MTRALAALLILAALWPVRVACCIGLVLMSVAG